VFRSWNIPSGSWEVDVLYVYSHRFGERKKNCDMKISGHTVLEGRSDYRSQDASGRWLRRVSTCCPAGIYTPPLFSTTTASDCSLITISNQYISYPNIHLFASTRQSLRQKTLHLFHRPSRFRIQPFLHSHCTTAIMLRRPATTITLTLADVAQFDTNRERKLWEQQQADKQAYTQAIDATKAYADEKQE
jgi:hypothetical protein